MNIRDIPTPEIYLESSDFRFFLNWFESVLTRIRFDTENVIDLYDPQRCPENLLWMLADTMGYKYDDRLSPAFCRLVLLYFMSMIKYKGSKSGVTLAAEVNLAQFNLQDYAKEKDILNNRLEDTSIPVNSVYVTAHTPEGYIDVVYFSTKKPIDACIEYVRPLGMFCFQHAGVSFRSRTKISVDGRLTNLVDVASGEGITRVGHYSREDYAKLQKMSNEEGHEINTSDSRRKAWSRNSLVDDRNVDAGYRALYSLQMSNNSHIVKSLLGPIFDLNYGPQDVNVVVSPYTDRNAFDTYPKWNLRYNQTNEENIGTDVFTNDPSAVLSPEVPPVQSTTPRTYPAVNPIMSEIGDAILLNIDSQVFTSDIIQGSQFTVNQTLPVTRIVSCKYGQSGSWTTLVVGRDYSIGDGTSGTKIVTLLSSSSVIPVTADPSKSLEVAFEYDKNTKYTYYNASGAIPEIDVVTNAAISE